MNRLSAPDMVRLGTVGIRSRPTRTVLAALGIAIGIAALISVIGIPASNQAAVQVRLATLGPNLLTVEPGNDLATQKKAKLPGGSVAMVRRIAPVQSASALGRTEASVYRSDRIPPAQTGGLSVAATRLDLLETLHASVRTGTFFNATTERYPVTVLGAKAAQILGIEPRAGEPTPLVWIDKQWFSVVGVLNALPLAPQVDYSVLVGWSAAQQYLSFDGTPGVIFVRADDAAVNDVRAVLGRTVNPQRPDQVLVSRPSDALAAQRLVEQAYSTLFLGLGAVALLVGGIGVANTMVISVLERRREIGLRRALGATRRQIGGQFLAESILLAGIGGGVGGMLGAAITAGYALYQHWPTVLPTSALLGSAAVAVVIGVLAGVYPAARAARLTPTEALNAA
jgi:putative ABC transport system permease protein